MCKGVREWLRGFCGGGEGLLRGMVVLGRRMRREGCSGFRKVGKVMRDGVETKLRGWLFDIGRAAWNGSLTLLLSPREANIDRFPVSHRAPGAAFSMDLIPSLPREEREELIDKYFDEDEMIRERVKSG